MGRTLNLENQILIIILALYIYLQSNYLKPLEIKKEIGNKREVSNSYNVISTIYAKQLNYLKAIEYLEKDIKIKDELGNKRGLAKAYNNLGLIYSKKSEYATSMEYLDKSLKIDEAENKVHKQNHIQYYRYYIITTFLLVLVISLFILNYLTQKRKANNILLYRNQVMTKNNIILEKQQQKIKSQSKKLKITNSKLSALNNTKDKLFSIISHDLKDPFNTLLGFSDILLENHQVFDIKKREKYLQVINDSSKKNFDLLTNLLTWSQTQMGQINYIPVKFYIKSVVDEILLLYKQKIILKNLKILIAIEDGFQLYTDENMLNIVLRNLISNAIKFTPKEGRIFLSVNCISNEVNQLFTEIKIKDTGVGISEEKQHKLFDIDSLNTSTKGTENETGTGLGLVLCKDFVEKIGGEIWVESEVGLGSLFIFTIPTISISV